MVSQSRPGQGFVAQSHWVPGDPCAPSPEDPGRPRLAGEADMGAAKNKPQLCLFFFGTQDCPLQARETVSLAEGRVLRLRRSPR